MKFLLITFMICNIVFAIDLNQDTELAQLQKSLDQLSGTLTGTTILELAQFHSEMNGPLDDLLDALHELEKEMSDDLARLEADYLKRTNQHERDRIQLEGDIGTLQFSLAVLIDETDNIIIPTINQTQKRLDQLASNIKDNRETLQRESQSRKKSHDSFLDQFNDHQAAINAIDECLQLLGGLLNGNVAFTERATLHHSLQLIQQRLEKSEFQPIIKALLDMAQNFSDQGTVQKIMQSLRDVRKSLVDSINQETADENERIAEWVKRQAAIQNEYNEFKNQIKSLTYTLVAYTNKQEREKVNIQNKKNDLQALQDHLDNENSNFGSDTSLYQDLKAQILRELNAATQALEFLQSANFSNLMKQRMNQGPLAGRY